MLTVIIPFKKIDKIREDNLKQVITHLLDFSERPISIMLVEGVSSSSTPLSLNFDNRVLHKVYPHDMDVFNKCKLYNYAIKQVKDELICFHDSDLIINLNALEASCRLLDDNNVKLVQPYDSSSFLEWDKDNSFKKGRNNLPLCGGCTIMRKEFIVSIGGWIEDFEKWGGEDTALDFIIERFNYKTLRLNGECTHLYHPPFIRDINLNETNEKILRYIFEMDNNEMIKFMTGRIKDFKKYLMEDEKERS